MRPSDPLLQACTLTWLFSALKGWTGRDSDQKMSHGEGLAHLLDAAGSKSNPDPFEKNIRDTLCVPVVSVNTSLCITVTYFAWMPDYRSHLQPKDTTESLFLEPQEARIGPGCTS